MNELIEKLSFGAIVVIINLAFVIVLATHQYKIIGELSDRVSKLETAQSAHSGSVSK
ncbi:MAG: hypothetical protein QMC36_01460 [Patescibacteria group bacterium]